MCILCVYSLETAGLSGSEHGGQLPLHVHEGAAVLLSRRKTYIYRERER